MNPTLFTARHNECRRPLWKDSRTTPIAEMFVCGAPTLPGKTHCAACRQILVAGHINSRGRLVPITSEKKTAGAAPRSTEPA